MAKKFDPNSVNDVYSLGRTHPYGRPPNIPDTAKVRPYEKPDNRQSEVQDPEDRPASHDDVAKGWLTGHGSKMHPHFDSLRQGREKK